jgi:S-adenosylmethionine:tRNA ribosyltransferase-isomerase
MLISDLDYELPKELVAQEPLESREASRMLVIDRSAGSFSDADFTDLSRYLRNDDLLVLNNTRVFPARLIGQSETGASIEIFLVEETEPNVWKTLARPGKRLHVGKRIFFSDKLSAEVVDKAEDGKVVVNFEALGEFDLLIDELGKTPLPPYIKRDRSTIDSDRERYQTVFAKNRGAIAAPTAGLHFTPDVLETLRSMGVLIAEITLHVGYGTFEPVRVNNLSDHAVAAERYTIDDETADLLNLAKTEHRRIVAVGTTTTRALESTIARSGHFVAGSHIADLTITPGYQFTAINALLTNFHLPQSSLLLMTSTFGGHELIMNAYRHAVADRYRFYSYGDCMLIV